MGEVSVKAQMYDCVVLTADVASSFQDAVIPKGTRGAVVEVFEQPQEGYAVDVTIPDDSVAGGLRFDFAIVLPEQFDVIAADPPPRRSWLLRARWWILAGFTMLLGDIALVTWGMVRDRRWVTEARHHCRSFEFPALPDNSTIGWVVLVSLAIAVLAVAIGAVLYARAAHWRGSAWVTAAMTAFLAVVMALGLLLLGLVMIEPRDLRTGVDGSGLPCSSG